MSTTRWARIGFALLAWLIVGLAIVQVYLAGEAVFADLTRPGNFELHRNFGWLIGIITLVQLVLAFAGRLGWRMIGGSALLFGLLVVQSVLVHIGTPNLAALHPVNGFLIIVVALWIAWRGVGYIRAPLPIEPARPEPVPAPAPVTPSGKPEGAEDAQ
jgi:hypothetical protein